MIYICSWRFLLRYDPVWSSPKDGNASISAHVHHIRFTVCQKNS